MMRGFATFYGKHRIIATNGSNFISSEARTSLPLAIQMNDVALRAKEIVPVRLVR